MAAQIGDNSKMLTPAEEKALFLHHLAACQIARAKTTAARDEEKRVRKLAKVDSVKLSLIDFGLRCGDVEDEQIIVDDLIEQRKIAEWMGLPVGAQPELDFDREPLVDRARREGLAAGRLAKDRRAPFDGNSEAGREWLAHYDIAQAEQRETLASAMAKRNAEAASAKRKKNGHAGDDDEDEGSATVGTVSEDDDDEL